MIRSVAIDATSTPRPGPDRVEIGPATSPVLKSKNRMMMRRHPDMNDYEPLTRGLTNRFPDSVCLPAQDEGQFSKIILGSKSVRWFDEEE
jgi:hypothetical protein